MIRICPKCNHVRQPADAGPDWQCPSCGVVYEKAGDIPVRRRAASGSADQTDSAGMFKLLGLALCLGTAIWLSTPLWKGHHAPKATVGVMTQPSIVLYGTEWCGYCAAAREFFNANGIQFTDLDVEKTTEGYEGHKKHGGRGVPLILVGEEVMHGYNEQGLKQTLAPWLKKND